MIAEIHTLAEYEAELAKPGLAVLDFYSPHCGPCHVRPSDTLVVDDTDRAGR